MWCACSWKSLADTAGPMDPAYHSVYAFTFLSQDWPVLRCFLQIGRSKVADTLGTLVSLLLKASSFPWSALTRLIINPPPKRLLLVQARFGTMCTRSSLHIRSRFSAQELLISVWLVSFSAEVCMWDCIFRRHSYLRLGYSWQTNQFGLAIDTVTAFELVKPDGTIANVTETSDPELFFALKVSDQDLCFVTVHLIYAIRVAETISCVLYIFLCSESYMACHRELLPKSRWRHSHKRMMSG